MHFNQCDMLLAGIAICRAEFPNEMLHPESEARFNILGAAHVAMAKNDKADASTVLDFQLRY